jgi:hypothetical protein
VLLGGEDGLKRHVSRTQGREGWCDTHTIYFYTTPYHIPSPPSTAHSSIPFYLFSLLMFFLLAILSVSFSDVGEDFEESSATTTAIPSPSPLLSGSPSLSLSLSSLYFSASFSAPSASGSSCPNCSNTCYSTHKNRTACEASRYHIRNSR